MPTIMQETRFDLLKREAVTLGDARGHVLACRCGELWITVDGEAGDIVLAAGEVYRIDSGARIVISALKAATVTVLHRQTFAPRRAGAHRLLVSLLQRALPMDPDWPATEVRRRAKRGWSWSTGCCRYGT